PPPPSHQATCSCTQHAARPPPPPAYEPVPQTPPYGRGFTNQMHETPGGAFAGTGAPDYNHHNHMYGASPPQPQPMQPVRTWTEEVWGHETAGLPSRTESPSQMETSMDGAVPNGMPAFEAPFRMPNAQDYLNRAPGAYIPQI
ncbi:hypothetical protein BDV93DRAFT_287123, partial [Ceratobasidium sp. AG-I]